MKLRHMVSGGPPVSLNGAQRDDVHVWVTLRARDLVGFGIPRSESCASSENELCDEGLDLEELALPVPDSIPPSLRRGHQTILVWHQGSVVGAEAFGHAQLPHCTFSVEVTSKARIRLRELGGEHAFIYA